MLSGSSPIALLLHRIHAAMSIEFRCIMYYYNFSNPAAFYRPICKTAKTP
jgi:hypothetical protein